MDGQELHDFLWKHLPEGKLPEKFSLIGVPPGYKRDGPPPKKKIEIWMEANRRKINRVYIRWQNWVDFEEGPFPVESIDQLCQDFSEPSDTVRVGGDFIPDNWITGEDKKYLARFDVSVYKGTYGQGHEPVWRGHYAVRETLIPVIEMVGIDYVIEGKQLVIAAEQSSMDLTRENLCAAYQFLAENNWNPSWIDGKIEQHEDGSSRRFSVHNFYGREEAVSPANLIKTVSVEIDDGKLTIPQYELLAQVLDSHGFQRSKLKFSYYDHHPTTFIP